MSSAKDIKDDDEQKLQHTKNEISSSRKECTSCEQNNVDDITEGITSIAVTTCASCGKEGNDSYMNTCNKCKSVKYCNAACKKKHRSKHKKACQKRVAELHEEQLFKKPAKEEDCPICFLRLPNLASGRIYMVCCGKFICSGCIFAVKKRDAASGGLCPFCRTPAERNSKKMMKLYNKRIELNDAHAIFSVGSYNMLGSHGFSRNLTRGLKLWHQAGELGYANAYYTIGLSYQCGRGVERDEKKALHYYELAAMGGHANARRCLGEYKLRLEDCLDKALKHFLIAVECGDPYSLKEIKDLYMNRSSCQCCAPATKEYFTKALQSYQEYLDEIKSEQRDEAAAAHDDYKYYESAF